MASHIATFSSGSFPIHMYATVLDGKQRKYQKAARLDFMAKRKRKPCSERKIYPGIQKIYLRIFSPMYDTYSRSKLRDARNAVMDVSYDILSDENMNVIVTGKIIGVSNDVTSADAEIEWTKTISQDEMDLSVENLENAVNDDVDEALGM